MSGQLSFVNATIGQRIGAGEAIADIKVLDSYKIQVSLSEYYIDRILISGYEKFGDAEQVEIN